MSRKWTHTIATVALSVLLFQPVSAQDPDSVASQDSLLQELERELGAANQTPTQPPTQARARPSTNPDISVIGDVRAFYVSEGERNIDFELHEVETAFKSAIDPYARADVYIAAHPEDGEIHFEMEEAYLTSLALPYRLQVRAGKFRNNVGKINRIHPHALPFLDTPLVYENYFGEEGLNDVGVGLSWLLPTRAFYQELSVEVTRGPDENGSFELAEDNRLVYNARLRNFWDLTENATLEIGLSGLTGPNPEGMRTNLGIVDVTYKWKPVRFNTYHSFTVQSEVFLSSAEMEESRVSTWGGYALASYQFARRWVATARFDQSDIPFNPDWNENRISTTLAWYATEFQKIEIGVTRKWADSYDAMYAGIVRAVFVIGTHGAHEY